MRTAELARNRWAGILQQFGVNPQHLRNKHTSCPFCGGKDRYRFDNKEGNGTWICSHCGSGNGFDFLTRITGEDFKSIAQKIDKIAGAVVEVKQKPKRDPSIYLRKIFKESTPNLVNTPVDKYLASRGLNVDNVQNVRYCAELAYYDDGKILGKHPAMIARFDDVNGEAVTYHVTYLSKGGSKASLPTVRKFLAGKGRLNGGAIRLGEADKVLYLAEGIETALSIANMHGVSCWAVGNAGLMEAFEVPDGIEQVCICADNDANYTGQKAAYTLANKLMIKGIKAVVYVPEVIGSDFNDELKGME